MGDPVNLARGLPARLVLPHAVPTLILVGSDDALVNAELIQLTARHAVSLDVRSDALWTEVADGRGFLKQLVSEFSDRGATVRVATAPPTASADDLVNRALLSLDLAHIAQLIETAELIDDPPLFQIRYQPVVDLERRAVLGYESLMRADVGRRTLDAEELIRRADAGQWLDELDALGRTLALRGVGDWLGAGLLFLNVIANDGTFDLAAIRDTVRAAEKAGIAPDQLVFEATERHRYRSIETVSAQIDEMRAMGVRIAIDDVGDGYSSLSVVASFKPDIVKLAGSLTRSLPSDEAAAIVTAVVQMAHGAGAWVVAENVETIAQARMMQRLGVDWGQGHYFGAPLERSAR